MPGIARQEHAAAGEGRCHAMLEAAVAEPDRIGEGQGLVAGHLTRERLDFLKGRVAFGHAVLVLLEASDLATPLDLASLIGQRLRHRLLDHVLAAVEHPRERGLRRAAARGSRGGV